MVRRHFYFALLLISFLPVSGLGQTPVKVSLCDLVKEPQKYTRQWVEVRGTVDIAFENFTLHTRDCGDAELRWIWLAYGGDEPTPTASTVNDRTRPSGAVLKVDNIPVQLRRDANLELFKGRLVAQRVSAQDGLGCHGYDCYFYKVTATLVGLFMAAPDASTNLSGSPVSLFCGWRSGTTSSSCHNFVRGLATRYCAGNWAWVRRENPCAARIRTPPNGI